MQIIYPASSGQYESYFKFWRMRDKALLYKAHSNRFECAFCLLYEQNISFNTIME